MPDVPDLPRVRLEDLLDRLGKAAPWPTHEIQQAVDQHQLRESRLRRWLPEKIVRRLDRGFARSNTVHPDTARALYSICRALRPAIVFETGTYWGYSTTYLAAALSHLGTGHIHSFDLYPEAGRHIPDSLRTWITLHRGRPATETMPAVLARHVPDLFFQDSVHDYDGVVAELRTVAPHLGTRAVVLLHDFVAEGVRRAALDALPGYQVCEVEGDDPQILGVAFRAG